MRKFKNQPSKSKFNGYLINTPLRKKNHENSVSEQTQTVIASRPAEESRGYQTTFVDNAKLSIRSSRNRQGGPKSKLQQRKEAINRQMTKTTLRKMRRYNTEMQDPTYDSRMIALKRHINIVNTTCNYFTQADTRPPASQQEQYAREEKRKYLMGQISFTEIDESRVCSQQQYLTQFQHLSRSMPKMLRTDQSQDPNSEAIILECLRSIDRVFVILRQMETAGYMIHTNRLGIQHCTNGRMWLKKVFLVESDDRRDSFSMAVKYYMVATPQQVKNRLAAHLSKDRSQPLTAYLADIEGLLQNLQSSLTQKKIARLINITNDIQGELKKAAQEDRKHQVRKARHGTTRAVDLRLTTQIQEAEAQWGPMREITKISRRKFEQLRRTYERLETVA